MPATTPEDRDRIRDLHAKGLGRNAIAREVGCSAATVTKIAKAAGLTFDRTATATAVAVRQVDLRARRQAIVQRLYARAEKNLDRLEAPQYEYRLVLNGGPESGDRAELIIDDDPPSADERNHMTAIAGYLGAAAKLELVDADGGATDAGSMLARLGEALGVSGPA